MILNEVGLLIKNSFYKKSVAAVIFTFLIFVILFVIIAFIFFYDTEKNDTNAEFISYERYVKNYIEELKSDISSAANSYDLKNFIENRNDRDIRIFFDYYMKKNNAPETIYLFDNENNCILSIGEDNKREEAFKFAADSHRVERVYISDFFIDKFTNKNYILFGRNIYYKNSEVKLIFSYNNENFEKFFIKINDENFFSVMLSDADTFVNFGGYEKNDKFLSDMDFIELSKIIKLKTAGTDYSKGKIESFSLNRNKNDILIYYKTVSDPDIILISLEKKQNVFLKMLFYTFVFFGIFIFLVIVFYSKIIRRFYLKFQKSKEEIENIDLTIDELNFTKTGFEPVDLYIYKIVDLCDRYKNILHNIKKSTAILNTNIGAIEISSKKGIVIYSPEIADFVGAESLNKSGDIGSMPIEEYFKFKNNNWKPFEQEKNIYCVETNNFKKWIKIFYYDKDEKKGIIIDASNYVIKRYKNTFDSDFESTTGFLKKEAFIQKTEEYIKNNKLSFGCFATMELSYYSTIYETYGEFISDNYLRTAVSFFSCFFDGFFVGIKNKGEFMTFIYSENSREDIKRKFQEWEDKISSNIFTAPDGREFRIKFIVGYACYPTDADKIDTLLKYSVFALYETKRLYKETVHPFALENYNRDMFMENKTKALDRLIDENRAAYHFQPIVNVKNCSIYGYEALLRTDDDIFTTPVDIINLALVEGKAYLLEEMNILNCMEIVKNNPSIFINKRLFINSIATNNLTEEDLKNIRIKYRDVKHLIVYELSTLFADNLTVINKSELFNRLGVKFAIDKFGGKYTNDFSLLSNSPEFIKIDRSLILDIHLKKEKQSHLIKIIKYAKENNINVIAVGIETYDELSTVLNLGIEFIQGYYISTPKSTFVTDIRENLKKEIKEIMENKIL